MLFFLQIGSSKEHCSFPQQFSHTVYEEKFLLSGFLWNLCVVLLLLVRVSLCSYSLSFFKCEVCLVIFKGLDL